MNHRKVLLPLLGVLLGMCLLTAASVPLYRVFCQVTGFGGTTRRVAHHRDQISAKTVTVRFNADVAPGLPWKFVPLQKAVTVHVGENKLVAFRATNLSNKPTEARAVYNVTPYAVGPYFNKIQCFCFSNQHLGPHESANMPVSFFIDPAMLDDKDARDVQNITLSYTFFNYDSKNKSKL